MIFLNVLVESDSNGTFHMDSSYTEQLNGYVTCEDYLNFLSKTNTLLKRLKRYRCLICAYLVPFTFLGLTIFLGSVFFTVYFDMPGPILTIVGVIVM